MTRPYTVANSLTNQQPIRWLLAAILMAIFTGCAKESDADDGMGRFETDEATVIAMSSGELQQFGVAEGQQLQKGMIVGLIENTELLAQREEFGYLTGRISAPKTRRPAETSHLAAPTDSGGARRESPLRGTV